MKNRLKGLVTAIGMLLLAPIASASIINFDFATEGTVAKGDCGILCYTIHTSGTAYDFSNDVPGTSSWAFNGYMTFYGSPWLGITDPFSPTSWSFVDNGASGNNLSGTFDWVFPPNLSASGTASYDILDGTGLFAGATGHGSSIISITRWFSGLPEFLEIGTMKVHASPKPVSEPEMTTLAVSGLLMLGFAAYRRRRADVPRQ